MAQRPQVNTDLGQPEAVRTVARPMMSRAPAYSMQQSRAGALAQSLLSIAPTLQGYVQEFQNEYKADEENRAHDTIQGMTFDQATELVKSGKMRKSESPWYQAAFEKQFGMVYAGRRKRELVDAYNNSFDKHSGDLDTFIAEFAGQDIDKFGGSEFIMSGYRDGMKGVLPTLRDQHAEWKSNWTHERVVENFGAVATAAIDDALANDANPLEAVRLLYGDHREAFGLTYGEMDAQVFSLAETYAARGNLEAVEAILGYEVVGEDGVSVGSFMTRPKYSLQAEKLLETAKANRGNALREENTATVVGLQEQAATGALDLAAATELRDQQQITLGEYERLVLANETAIRTQTIAAQKTQQENAVRLGALNALHEGKAYSVMDQTVTYPDGTTKTFTREQLLEGAVVDSMNAMAAKKTPVPLMAEELSRYGVDVTYPVWENVLSDGYLSLTENLAKPDKDGNVKVPDNALAGYATWKALNDTPQLRSRHINNRDAEDVWSAAYLLEQNGYEPQDALLRAAAPPSEAGVAAANNLTREQITKIAGSVEGGMFSEDTANGAMAIGNIEALTKFYVARGVPTKAAVKQSITDFNNSYTNINGSSVNTRNIYLPQHFEDASKVVLQQFAELHGEDADDLTMVPSHDGSNNWIIAYKGNVAMPVQVSGGGNRIHVSDIEDAYKQEQADLAQQAFEAAQDAIKTEATDQGALEQNSRDIAEWHKLTRKQRKERGWPTSFVGAQMFFSRSGVLRQKQRDKEISERTTIAPSPNQALGAPSLTTDGEDIQKYLNSLGQDNDR